MTDEFATSSAKDNHRAPNRTHAAYAVLTILSGAFGAFFWLARDRGASREAVAQAAKELRAQARAGDLILIAPYYATMAREYLGDLHPVAPRDPAAEDFRRHDRVWVFGTSNAGTEVVANLLEAGLVLKDRVHASPGVTVDALLVSNPWEVTYDFVSQLREARVFHEHPGSGLEPCATWDDKNGQGGALGRWLCPHDSEWFYVAPEWHRMGDVVRLCLWAHPPNEGRLIVRYSGVPVSGHFFAHAGHTLNASVHARERVDLAIAVNDLPPQTFPVALDTHWQPIHMRVPTAETATVSFVISSPDAGANHFCFAPEFRRPKKVGP